MKGVTTLILILCLATFERLHAQTVTCPPPNIGFEDGTFNNWQCDTGHIDNSGVVHLSPTSGPIATRQILIDKNYPYPVDYWGGFPTLCPNGSGHSIQLGSGAEDAGTQAQSVSYTFTVPPSSGPYNLIVNYAMVLQYTGPTYKYAPRFTIKTYDITDGVYISCSTYDFYVVAGQPEWKVSPNDINTYYHDWATAAINLTGFAGKNIRLEFTTNDYAFVKEAIPFCYAYIDVNQDCASPITGNAYCTGQNSVTLTAPPGFTSYVWLNPADLSKDIGFSSTLTISPPPPDQTQYALVTRSAGCFDTLYTVVNKIDAGFVFKVEDTIYACAQTPVDLTAAGVTAGSSSGLNYSYYSDSTALNHLYFPDKITSSGTYYIKAQSAEGCTNVLPVTVIILTSQTVQVTNPPPVVYPATVDITTAFNRQNGFTYNYYSNNSATAGVADPQHINLSGTYYIRALNIQSGCSTIAPVTVVVNPPPAPVVNAPNTFTPNNDGINDHFFVTIVGYEQFSSLSIFNRYGQLIFETKSENAYWDGTFNGKMAAPGTYYWVVEGVNLYYHQKHSQAGSITLIR